MIYVIRCSRGLLKVGHTRSLSQRVRGLASETGGSVTLLAAMPGSRGDEHAAHRELTRCRSTDRRGVEWYEEGEHFRSWLASRQGVIPCSVTVPPRDAGPVLQTLDDVQRRIAAVDSTTPQPGTCTRAFPLRGAPAPCCERCEKPSKVIRRGLCDRCYMAQNRGSETAASCESCGHADLRALVRKRFPVDGCGSAAWHTVCGNCSVIAGRRGITMEELRSETGTSSTAPGAA